MIIKGFINEHLETACQLRLVECETCHQKITHKDVKDHPEVCPSVEISCPNDGCSTRIFRGQLSAHLNICPKQQIKCPYREVGCDVQILRKDLQKHLQGSIEHHSTVARDTVISLRKEVEELQLSTRVPPLTFKVKDYSKFMEKEQWTTKFSTHIGGYKMGLSIYPRGNAENNKGHVSILFSILGRTKG
jgi:TNF receptor-associated factor 4